jgi:hypothetical protein
MYNIIKRKIMEEMNITIGKATGLKTIEAL